MVFAPEVSFRLRNFRVFKDSGLQKLRPLTFLVGENSSGKSSLLAALNYILRFREGVQKSSFNTPPFELGGFDQIVFSRKGVTRPDHFDFEVKTRVDFSDGRLQFQFPDLIDEEGGSAEVSARLVFTSYHGEPRIDSISFHVDEVCLKITFSDGPNVRIFRNDELIYPLEGEQQRLPRIFNSSDIVRGDPQTLSYILGYTLASVRGFRPREKRSSRLKSIQRVIAAAQGFSHNLPYSTVATAPTRTSPSRVYNPSDYSFQPDGSHTPYVLNRLKSSDKKSWERIRGALEKFGSEAGLFTKIHISKYHLSDSSPFQIGVTVNGRQSNLLDVGYGVSQSLPIVVDSLDAQGATFFLVQQPEVHLHPQAQAALASFFIDQVLNRSLGYVIETHSDFIINRVRIAIMEGEVPPELVQILYLKKNRSTVDISNITIDRSGNLLNDPPGYRGFFLREGHRLLGIGPSVHNNR